MEEPQDNVEALDKKEAESSPSDETPIAEVAIGAGVALAGAAVITEAEAKDEQAVVEAQVETEPEQAIVEAQVETEPEKLVAPEVNVEEPEKLKDLPEDPATPSSKSNKRRHRSSRHSHSSHHSSSKDKDSPTSERPHSHRKRRESENSVKGLLTKDEESSPKATRHDSGISAGSSSSHSKKHRKDRTPEEQEAHDQRKAWRKAEREKLAKAAPLLEDVPPGDGVPGEARIVDLPPLPHRQSSTRRYSRVPSSGSRDMDEKRPPHSLFSKGESVVKTPFLASDKSHYKEKEVKAPIMNRPRFSIDGERPTTADLGSKTSTSGHHHSSSRSHRKDRDDGKRKEEEEKEARRFRRETEKQMEIARVQVAEDSRRAQEKDDEERRLRRLERRKRRSVAENNAGSRDDDAAAVGGGIGPSSANGGSERGVRAGESETERNKLVKPRERVHRSHHRREKELREKEEKEKRGPLTSLFKKMFS